MAIGISTASFFNKVPTEDSFDALRNLGCNLTEVFLNTRSEYKEAFVTGLADKKGDITVHSLHTLGLQFEPELFSISERVRRDSEENFRKVCRAGQILGAKYYSFHGPARLKNQKYTLDFGRFGDTLNSVIAITEGFGMKLSYETVHWCHFSKPDFFANLAATCPRLYATLDVKQCLQGGIDPLEFLDAIGNRLSTVHLCDLDNEGNTCLPGRGKYDFGRFFAELCRRGLGGVNMLLEVYPRDYGELGELVEVCGWLTSLQVNV